MDSSHYLRRGKVIITDSAPAQIAPSAAIIAVTISEVVTLHAVTVTAAPQLKVAPKVTQSLGFATVASSFEFSAKVASKAGTVGSCDAASFAQAAGTAARKLRRNNNNNFFIVLDVFGETLSYRKLARLLSCR
jgi:hypothetical protein